MTNQQLLEIICSLAGKQETSTVASTDHPFEIGKAFYIRTVTYHAIGRVKAIKGKFLVLEDAAWVSDSGRFRQAIMDGVLDEVEPVDVEMYLNLDSVVDAFPWKTKLPREQK